MRLITLEGGGPRKAGFWLHGPKVINMIMVARTLNDHLRYPDVEWGRQRGNKATRQQGMKASRRGARWSRLSCFAYISLGALKGEARNGRVDLAAVIHFSKSGRAVRRGFALF